MTRFRETNHLRKYANEAGKQMRGPRSKRKPSSLSERDREKCARCQVERHIHEMTHGLVPDHKFVEPTA